MFKVDGNLLKLLVQEVARSAKRSRLAQSFIYCRVASNKLTLAISGEVIPLLQKTVDVQMTKPMDFVTTVQELEFKTKAIPDDVTVEITEHQSNLAIKWGRGSSLALFTNPESIPTFDLPPTVAMVPLPPGKLHYISRTFGGFPALVNSDKGKEHPVLTGIHFAKQDTDEVFVQSSNGIRAIKNYDVFDWFDGLDAAIPAEAIHALTESIDVSVNVNIHLSENKNLLVFETGDTKAVVRLINEAFPDTSRLFSDEKAPIIWRADRMELLQIARRIKFLGDRPVVNVFSEGSKTFAELEGILKEQIGAVVESSVKEGFSVNAENVELAMTSLRSEEVLICFQTKGAPVTFLSADEETAEKLKVMAAQITPKE